MLGTRTTTFPCPATGRVRWLRAALSLPADSAPAPGGDLALVSKRNNWKAGDRIGRSKGEDMVVTAVIAPETAWGFVRTSSSCLRPGST